MLSVTQRDLPGESISDRNKKWPGLLEGSSGCFIYVYTLYYHSISVRGGEVGHNSTLDPVSRVGRSPPTQQRRKPNSWHRNSVLMFPQTSRYTGQFVPFYSKFEMAFPPVGLCWWSACFSVGGVLQLHTAAAADATVRSADDVLQPGPWRRLCLL